MKMVRSAMRVVYVLLCAGLLLSGVSMQAQTTVTYSGVIKDLTGAVVKAGQVTFTLKPSVDTTIASSGRFVPLTIACNINADGTLSGFVDGLVSGPCLVTSNLSLFPAGTSYQICVQPNYATPGSCFYDYAYSSKDISTVVPTLTTGPLNYSGIPGPPGPAGSGVIAIAGKNALQVSNAAGTGLNAYTGQTCSAGQVASGNSANGTPTCVQGPYQVSGTAAQVFGGYANSDLAANSTSLFSDGTQSYCAGPAYCSNGTYIDDTTLTIMANPAQFPAANVLNLLNKFVATKNANGEFPIALGQPATQASAIYYSFYDNYHYYATGDGRIMVPQLLYAYCQAVGITSTACTSAYTSNVAAIKVALAYVPRTSGLITVTLGNEYVAGFAFQEYMRSSGTIANAVVWDAIDYQKLIALANAAGDTTNATAFTTAYNTDVAGLSSLIDATSGLLIAASGQNSTNLDVVTSSLACQNLISNPILTKGQCSKIASYFATNYSTLVNAAGYVRQTPTGWATIGSIPSTGGAPYGAVSFTSTQYQGGYWSVNGGWFANVLEQSSPRDVTAMFQAYALGADPKTEWYNVGSAAPQGTTPNLESPQGMYQEAQLVNTPTQGFGYILPNKSAATHLAIYAAGGQSIGYDPPLSDDGQGLSYSGTSGYRLPLGTLFSTSTNLVLLEQNAYNLNGTDTLINSSLPASRIGLVGNTFVFQNAPAGNPVAWSTRWSSDASGNLTANSFEGPTGLTSPSSGSFTTIASTAYTTASIGGAALAAGACASGPVTVTGVTNANTFQVSPQTYPGAGFVWEAYYSAANTVTVNVCAIAAATPTASLYNVRVTQ